MSQVSGLTVAGPPPRVRGILIHLGGQALGFLTEWLVPNQNGSQNGTVQPYGRFPALSELANHSPLFISLGFDASAAMQIPSQHPQGG